MCGIVGYVGSEEATPKLVSALRLLTYRGYDSCGIATANEHGISYLKSVGPIDNVASFYPLQGKSGIGHTRWATHGGVTQANAHPHLDCKEQIAVVHNGIIDNWEELKIELIAKGHVFKSETDTEVIPHLIEGWHKEHLVRSNWDFGVLKGSYALAILIQTDHESKVVGVRKGSPLIVAVAEDNSCWLASDPLCLPPRVKNYYTLAEGEIVFLPDDKEKIIEKSNLKRPKLWTMPEKKGYYMLSEILDSGEAIRSALNQDENVLRKMALEILRAKQVIFSACGTSRHAAIIGRYLFSKVGGKFSDVVMASEFQYFADSVDKGTLVIALSQSGETADVLEGVKQAKARGARILSLVNVPSSSLETLSDYTLKINCGPEISVAATKSFIAQLSLLYQLTYALVDNIEFATSNLQGISHMLDVMLKEDYPNLRALGESLSQKVHPNDFYLIARGVNFAIATEAALKLKEICYVHAEGMAAGELKHGTLALIEQGTPVIAICPQDETYEETLANIHEAKARGAYIIGVSNENNSVFDFWLPVSRVEKVFYPLVCVVPLYLLAYYLCVNRGLNPDRPRNLAKSVTVK